MSKKDNPMLDEASEIAIREFCSGKTQLDALIAAGYSKDKAEILQKEFFKRKPVKARIKSLTEQLASKKIDPKVTREYVSARLKEIVEKCLQHMTVLNKDGMNVFGRFNAADAVSALKLMCEMEGFMRTQEDLQEVESFEVILTHKTHEEIKKLELQASKEFEDIDV